MRNSNTPAGRGIRRPTLGYPRSGSGTLGSKQSSLDRKLEKKRAELAHNSKIKNKYRKMLVKEGYAVEKRNPATSDSDRDDNDTTHTTEPQSVYMDSREKLNSPALGGKRGGADPTGSTRQTALYKSSRSDKDPKFAEIELEGASDSDTESQDLNPAKKNAKANKRGPRRPKPSPFSKATSKKQLEIEKKETARKDALLLREKSIAEQAARQEHREKYIQQRQKIKASLGKKTLKGQPVMANQIKHLLEKIKKG
ncbi:hypothetical protein BASA50_003278 [Batrachochytrium salamandrivorans]|uniref:rRNA-processing protein FYV7 n=1 Tax=Batrachochytrium salamandrivorans TaxID=1357716 RepID=A0ABQ8FLW9_9FUNG|nr:hypothetical protein BASA62_006090 [Batrachochytrium salamandrivorans]KAH6569436.1 hypothetical protein BASA60_008195 [Batrachochytrium salamandrivorans]KAH6599068.1 hypothetical protein BASA50_003278 [Batrachochytrium salamandrivorans]KAH9265961.1 hypothetical protein BASA83_010871 [Batrachochytrium salamandrivorans]